MKIIELNQVDSTNRYAKNLIEDPSLELPLCISAKDQTAGKGQGENKWFSEAGKNIHCSFIFKPEIQADQQFLISKAVSLAACSFLKEFHSGFTVKWPNDIYFKDKKIAGILIENILAGNHIKFSIIGIGININQNCFPDELPNPVSLKQISLREYALPKLQKQLAGIMQDNLKLHPDNIDKINQDYLDNLYQYNRRAHYADSQGEFEGIITGIGTYGHLCVKNCRSGEQKKYDFKEIVFMRKG